MRLLAGWLCLSLASVWLARRMWTLRSPLSRSLYVNMTSGPGGPAAAAGGGKDTHQVASGRNHQKFWKSRDRIGRNK
ncbi:protein-L-histidine N-pros-methyltransferase isoform X5 [Peromyscus eremicus]|uniref:protein-L-histidine N-pros-methyltransferase isoform X5 n=1 Tax=Peromyscus eremicus TaxID=42410 RepID=UPI0027DE026A|nr:protein-L-histidine N-pros-methyltransferase isoform X5 [Peromyscus eremicus]